MIASREQAAPLTRWPQTALEAAGPRQGAVQIEIEGGPTLELKPGDMACLPKGAVTRWHLTLPFKEMWVLAGA